MKRSVFSALVLTALLAGALAACNGHAEHARDDGGAPGGATPTTTPTATAAPTATGSSCESASQACYPDCAPDDPGCQAGFWDEARCACVPLSGCGEGLECPAPQVCLEGRCSCPEPELPCLEDCDEASGGCERGRQHPATCACVRTVVRRMTGLSVDPASVTLPAGTELELLARGLFDDGTHVDVSSTVRWESDAPAVVESLGGGRILAAAPGTAEVVASTGDLAAPARIHVVESCGGEPDPPVLYEARGVWVTRWDYRDAAGLRDIVDRVAAAGFNMLFFQVRGTCDAYYTPGLEPWAQRLTGTLGQDPGWDPLAVALEAAHAEGLELHAWMNSFACWTGEFPPPASTPEHVLRTHPEWAMVDSAGNRTGAGGQGYVFASPGAEGMRAHLAAVATDIARRYDVDGVHLDYIRYSGRDMSHDPDSNAAFAAARAAEPGLQRGDWQRRMVSDVVARVHAGVMGVRPSIKLTAAVWGVYENRWGWSAVSEGRNDFYQDARAWVSEGTIDALIPMVYWPPQPRPGDRLDYGTLVAEHVEGGAGRHVYAGTEADVADFAQLEEMILRARAAGAPGAVLFTWSYIRDAGFEDDLAAGPYADPAEPPLMPWKR